MATLRVFLYLAHAAPALRLWAPAVLPAPQVSPVKARRPGVQPVAAQSPRTPPVAPSPRSVVETAYDESHEPAFDRNAVSDYGRYTSGSRSAWSDSTSFGVYKGKGGKRVEPGRTERMDPHEFAELRRRRDANRNAYVGHDRTPGYGTGGMNCGDYSEQ